MAIAYPLDMHLPLPHSRVVDNVAMAIAYPLDMHLPLPHS